VADIPRPGTLFRPGQPVVTIFAAGDSAAQVERALRARVAQTQRKLYVNRPDD
jgi:predicted ATP-grasp superfamily ATP-dependent carboligase